MFLTRSDCLTLREAIDDTSRLQRSTCSALAEAVIYKGGLRDCSGLFMRPASPAVVPEPYSRSGNISREISRRIERPCPGTRSMSQLVSTIWCTEGGDTLKYLCSNFALQ